MGPYTRPILTEVDGIAAFEDLVEGASVTETADEATGITKRVVTDWRSNTRGADLKPAVTVKDADGKVLKLSKGGDARYLLAVDAILSVEPGARVHAGDVLAVSARERQDARHHRRSAAGGGAVRGAAAKDHAIIAEVDGNGAVRQGLQEQAPRHHRAA